MDNISILLLIIIIVNTVYCYDFYNPNSHKLLERKSMNKISRGYKLMASPKNYRRTRRRTRLTRGRTNSYCTEGGFTCDEPYDKSLTSQFECRSDKQCPSTYKCCSQKCFLHKICVKAYTPAPTSPPNSGRTRCNERPGQCEKWPYNCVIPYDYSYTYVFKCNSDRQCPRNFKCCQQSCFTHRICSRIVIYTNKTVTNVISTDKPEVTIATENVEDNAIGIITTTEGSVNTTTTATTTESTTSTTTEASTLTTTESTTLLMTESSTITTIEDDKEEPEDYEETEEVETTVAEADEDIETTTVPTIMFPQRTTPDINAINPEYAEYYYNYDNNNATDEDTYEDEEDYEDEAFDKRRSRHLFHK